MQTPPANDRVGSTIGGRYALRRLLGVGGFSAVYEATHTITDRAVALKLLHPHLVTNPEVADRFLLEARAMARIKHEGIVQVLDAGIDESSSIYIVLELLEGESLETCLQRQGALPWTELALYCAHVLDALAEAHRYGVVHRDIKPGNIFIARTPDGGSQARLLDFGIALVARGNVRLTGAGMLLGTPEYMSPEQCLTADVGPEADVWAIGVVMWECLTGHTPFNAETATATLLRIAHEQAQPIRSVMPELPPPIASVIDKALAHDITDRWRSAEEMRDALLRVLRKGTGAAAVAAARLTARIGGRTSMLMHPGDERNSQSEVVDLSVVQVAQSLGGPGKPLAQVVAGDGGARLAPPPQPGPRGRGSSPSTPRVEGQGPTRRPSSPSTPRVEARVAPSRVSSPSTPRVEAAPASRLQAQVATQETPLEVQAAVVPVSAAEASTRPSRTYVAARPPSASMEASPTTSGPYSSRRPPRDFELPEASASVPPEPELEQSGEMPAAPRPPSQSPEESFALPDLSPEERAARSFTGDRATFRAPPTEKANRRGVYIGAAAAAVALVGGLAWALLSPDAVVQNHESLHTTATPPAPPRAAVSFTQVFELPSASTSTDENVEFARHAVGSVMSAGIVRLWASCVSGLSGSTLYAKTNAPGAARKTVTGVVACGGHDLGVLPDLTSDDVEELVAVGATPDTLVLLDGNTLIERRRTTVEGLRGLALGAQVRTRAEPVVVVFAEPAGPAAPTEVRAIGALTMTERWRYHNDGTNTRVGQPEELGLATGPDANDDGVGDVVVGMSPPVGAAEEGRCVQLLSGADGRALWATPFCRAAMRANQSLSLGPDVNGDGHADVVVGTAHPPTGGAPVVLLSGVDGAVLRSINAPAGAVDFGATASLGGDIDGDGVSDVVVSSRGAVFVFDAATGALRATLPLGRAAGANVRAMAVPPLAEGPWGVLVATPTDGLRVLVRAER